MSINCICFDLDGVYFTPAGKTHFLEQLIVSGASPEKAHYAFAKSPEMNEKYKRGLITTAQFWDYMNGYLSLNLSPDCYETILVAGYEIDPKVRSDIKKVRSLGIKTCLCSSNFEARVRCLQKKFSFLDDFDIQVFSYLEGINKPDPALFQILINKCGCMPSQIVYADDKPDPVTSAASLGINAVQVVDYTDYKTYLLQQGINL